MTRSQDIESYVNALARDLHHDFRDDPDLIERIASETRDHLLEDRDRRIESGISAADAEHAAIEQFGSVRAVSQHFSRDLGVTLSPPKFAASLVLYATSLAGAMIAAAGLIMIAVTALAFATGSLNPLGPTTGVTFTGADCTGLTTMPAEPMGIQSYQECVGAQAALGSTAHMVFLQILLIGGAIAAAAGGFALILSQLLQRSLHRGRTDHSLLGNTYRVVGAVFFGLLTLIFVFAQVDSGSGASFAVFSFWPATIVTLIVCAAYARSLRRALA